MGGRPSTLAKTLPFMTPPAVDYRRHPSRHFLRPTQQDAPLPV
jgi:hypothetical protein